MGRWIWRASKGIDHRPVVTSWERQSYGREDTLPTDATDVGLLCENIQRLAMKVSASLKRDEKFGRTVTLKIKYSNFESITRSKSLVENTDQAEIIAATCRELLTSKTDAGLRPVRLVGVSVSNLKSGFDQSTITRTSID
jgi:DNA polymerase-4